jgi:hypothetical protein
MGRGGADLISFALTSDRGNAAAVTVNNMK